MVGAEPAEVILPDGVNVENAVVNPTEVNDAILNAQWGQFKGTEIREAVTKEYYIVAHWKRNIFYIPTGQAGQSSKK